MKTELVINSPSGVKITDIDTRIECTITTNGDTSELVLSNKVDESNGFLLSPTIIGVNGVISEQSVVEINTTYGDNEKITMCRLQIKLVDYRRIVGIDHIAEILTIIGSELI